MYPNPWLKKVKISPEFYKNNIDLFENDVQKIIVNIFKMTNKLLINKAKNLDNKHL